MKKIWIITLFPDYFLPLTSHGVIGKVLSGERGGQVELKVIQLAKFSKKSFKGVDSSPFGGGPGVVMRADVLQNALLSGVVAEGGYDLDLIKEQLKIVYTSPRGKTWSNKLAKSYGEFLEKDKRDMVFICGRYEGIDERFIDKYIDEIISLGDFVLSGGELAVMAIIDSSIRFIKGSLTNDKSAVEESFEYGLIEGPCYTRPQHFEGKEVPSILLSGNHKNIAEYNHSKKKEMTKKYRPDLFELYLKNRKRYE